MCLTKNKSSNPGKYKEICIMTTDFWKLSFIKSSTKILSGSLQTSREDSINIKYSTYWPIILGPKTYP